MITFAAIVAASENNVIGIDNKMPWHIKEDLKFFKNTTLGHPIIMGRNTFHSLGDKPLPGRLNIIISSNAKVALVSDNLKVFSSIELAKAYLATTLKEGKAFIIGGGMLYKSTLGYVNEVYLTRIHTQLDNGDAFFPILTCEQWLLQDASATFAPEPNQPYAFTFEHWVRK